MMSAMYYKYFHEVKDECSIQPCVTLPRGGQRGYSLQGTRYKVQGETELNRTFHLSPNENIYSIAQMENIHYLFYITCTNIHIFKQI